jgi:hypothetical protein
MRLVAVLNLTERLLTVSRLRFAFSAAWLQRLLIERF